MKSQACTHKFKLIKMFSSWDFFVVLFLLSIRCVSLSLVRFLTVLLSFSFVLLTQQQRDHIIYSTISNIRMILSMYSNKKPIEINSTAIWWYLHAYWPYSTYKINWELNWARNNWNFYFIFAFAIANSIRKPFWCLSEQSCMCSMLRSIKSDWQTIC